MKILITGGKGFIGNSIAKKLSMLGHEISTVSRSSDYRKKEYITAHHQYDLSKDNLNHQILKNIDVVFHVAAKAGIEGKYNDYYASNYLATKLLLDACKSSSVQNFIYTSSPSVVFTKEPIKNANENLPYIKNKVSPYAQTKAIAEKEVLNSNDNINFKTIALRPHLVWGEGDPHLLPKVIRRHAEGKLKIVGDGLNQVDLTHIDNVTHAHVTAMNALISNKPVGGKAYFISQSEPVQLWKWLNDLFIKLKLPPLKKRVSFQKAYLAGMVAESLWGLFNFSKDLPMSRFAACQLSHDHWFSNYAAEKDLGYRPIISMEKALDKTIPWLQAISDSSIGD